MDQVRSDKKVFVASCGRQLREIIEDSGMKNVEIARIAGLDPSMICYMSRGGRGSLRTTNAIADAIVSRVHSLELRACLWVLACGYAPTRLNAATTPEKIHALRHVGVGGDA